MEKIKLNYLILLMMVLNAISATAYDFEVDGIYYNIKGSEAEVTYEGYYHESTGKRSFWEDEDFYYNDYTGHVTIPSTVTYDGMTYLVTGIGDFAFSERMCGAIGGDYPYPVGSVTSVTIPNTVTSIGFRAFEYCQYLTSITIPNSVVAIGEDAFVGSAWYNNHWYNNQPNGLIYAGLVAYKYVGSMPDGTHITLNQGTKGIAGSAFSGCSRLTTIDIPSSVVHIGDNAFSGCYSLTTINIPSFVRYIGDNAFSNCNSLTTINIPSFVDYIGDNPFINCSNLTSISVASGNPNYDSRDNCNAIIETATNTLIAGCQNTMIPYTVTSIGNYSFYGCSGLSSVSIPNSIKTIGTAAFDGCTGLTSIILGNSVKTIGSWAFGGCSGLISVTIPESVTNIAISAFLDCTALRILNYNAVSCVFNYDEGSVGSVYSPFNYLNITTINIGEHVQKIPDYFAYRLAQLSRVTIPNSVKTIGYEAFRGCSDLTSVDIPNSVISIGENAFYYCSGLTSLTIGNSVTSIGSSAFQRCNGLTNLIWNALDCSSNGNMSTSNIEQVTIGNEVKVLPSSFVSGSKISSVTIPNSVISIGENAFYGCSGLSNVTIPDSVTFIGSSAFYGCSGLTSATIGNSISSIGYSAFAGCTGLTRVNISNLSAWCGLNCQNASSNPLCYAQHLYLNDAEVTDLVVPDDVEAIGDYTFYNCNLSSIRISKSVTTVGSQAFNNSPSIKTVTCEATTPPAWNNLAMFTTNVYYHTPLFVPRGCAGAYMSDQCWGQFAKIVSSGDTNMDGNISISDVTTLIDLLLSGGTSPAADVNNDGRITIADVTALIDFLLTGNWN